LIAHAIIKSAFSICDFSKNRHFVSDRFFVRNANFILFYVYQYSWTNNSKYKEDKGIL